MARTGASLVVWCKACRHQEKIGFDNPVTMAKGDVRVIDLQFRCTPLSLAPDGLCRVGSHVRPKV